jgi:Calcineurin-like phosphoesterase
MRSVISLWLLVVFPQLAWSQQLTLPLVRDSLRFAVIGDTGTGTTSQYQVGKTLIEYRSKFPYEFVLMLGDNLYGNEEAKDFEKKFERPYKPLLDAGIKFYAALGNHDDPNQRFYKLFNMNGERYYSFRPKAGVRFFALDSNYMDKKQLEWLEKELSGSGSDWKICFFHHPLYSSGEKHGPAVELRKILEPVLLKHNASVVFAGHEHFYERLKPQKGIYHFTQGGSAKLREGNLAKTDLTAKGFDQDNSFMLVEIAGDQLYFQTISRSGKTVDSGVIRRTNGKPDSTNQ